MKTQRERGIFHLLNFDNARSQSIVLAAAALWLINSGCAIHRSEATRTRSFKPYTAEQIDGVAVRSFLSSRVALLITADQLPVLPTNGVAICPGRDFKAVAGYATAIDRRGYFLTAARLVKKDTIYLVLKSEAVEDAAQTRDLVSLYEARVLWRGEPSKGQPDLAILHVPCTLDHVFEWVTNAQVGDPVMAVGLSRSKTNFLGPEFLGGTILEYGWSEGEPSHMVILHDVPEQSGDIGGPLVARDGRLIGINYDGQLSVHLFLVVPAWKFFTYAVYPDPGWLKGIIERDAAAYLSEPAAKDDQSQASTKR